MLYEIYSIIWNVSHLRGIWPCALNFEECWGYLMPLSETFVHRGANLSLRKQSPPSCFVSLLSQTWPLCLQSRRSACIPLTLTLTFQFCILPGAGGPQDHCSPKAFWWGENMWQYPLRAWWARGTICLWPMSPLPIGFIVLSFKEPVIKLTTPSSLSNQTLQPDLVVFQRIIGVARLKLRCNKLQSFEIEHLLSLWFTFWSMINVFVIVLFTPSLALTHHA